MPYIESLVYQRVLEVQGRDRFASGVREDFLEEAAFDFSLKGHCQFLAGKIMVSFKGQRHRYTGYNMPVV